jgi:glycosyltransferase involved in cell wall biosynthesis
MKICFISKEIYPFYYGGIGTQIYCQMKLLSENNHEIFFLTEKPSNFNEAHFRSIYTSINVVFVERDAERYKSHNILNYAFSVEKAFKDLYQAQKIDLGILADFHAEAFFILLKKDTEIYKDVRFLVEIHGPCYEVLKYDAEDSIGFFDSLSSYAKIPCYMENYSIPQADYFLAPSHKVWEEVSERLQIRDECEIIPNFANTEIFKLKEFTIKEQTVRRIVFAGRLEKRKGVHLLIEAIISILSKEPSLNIELILVGQDLFWKEYQDTFQHYWENQIPDIFNEKIKFLGQIPQTSLQEYLSEAWVGVFPSIWEPFGIVALEAMLCGSPVIVTSKTGLEEVVGTDYGVFFHIEQGTEGLEKVLLEVLNNVELRNTLAKKSHKRAKELFVELNKTFVKYVNSIGSHLSLPKQRLSKKAGYLKDLYVLVEEYDTHINEGFNSKLSELSYTKRDLESCRSLLQEYDAKLKTMQLQMEELEETSQYRLQELIEHRIATDHLKDQLKDVQNTISMMEQSRFWKVRNLWFKLKKKVGLIE